MLRGKPVARAATRLTGDIGQRAPARCDHQLAELYLNLRRIPKYG